jgi:hypothetical protein
VAWASESFARPVQAVMHLVALAICLLATDAVAAESAVKADIVFSGMWWSEQQVVGMNPDHPPPMTTRAMLGQWNAEDNQWPPHPDVVDVDVTLTGKRSTSNVPVQIGYQWYAKGQFTPLKMLRKDTLNFDGETGQTLHSSIKVMEYLNQEHFPKRLRVVINIASQKPIIKELPLVLGD